MNAAERAGFDLDELSFYGRALNQAELQILAVATQCPPADAIPRRPIFEVRTAPENIGVTVGIGGETPAMNHYATTTVPGSVTASPETIAVGAGTEYRFRSWSVNDTAEAAWTSLSQTVPPRAASATYTANYDTFFRLTVNVVGNCAVSPASGFYRSGSQLPVSVTLPSGSTFSATHNSQNVANGALLTISVPGTLDVNCRGGLIPVTVSISPASGGLTVIADGVPVTAPQTFSWIAGAARTLSVPTPIQVVNGVQYTFRRWRHAAAGTIVGSTPVVQITPSAAAEYVAEFDRTGLSVQLNHPTGCQIDPFPALPASGFYAPGTRVAFNLVASAGYAAVSLTISGGEVPVTQTGTSIDYLIQTPIVVAAQCRIVEAARNVTVTFASVPSTVFTNLRITFQPAGGGPSFQTRGFNPATLQVGVGTLTLMTDPNPTVNFGARYRFVNITPGNFANTVTIPAPTASTSYTATYEVVCYFQQPHGVPLGSGSMTISGPGGYADHCYAPGSVVTLTAYPNPGYTFSRWRYVDRDTTTDPITRNPLTYRVPNRFNRSICSGPNSSRPTNGARARGAAQQAGDFMRNRSRARRWALLMS